MAAVSANQIEEQIKEDAAKARRWFELLTDEERGRLMNDNFRAFPHYLKEDVMRYFDTISIHTHYLPEEGRLVVLFNQAFECPVGGTQKLDFDEKTQVFFSHEAKIIIGVKDMMKYFSK